MDDLYEYNGLFMSDYPLPSGEVFQYNEGLVIKVICDAKQEWQQALRGGRYLFGLDKGDIVWMNGFKNIQSYKDNPAIICRIDKNSPKLKPEMSLSWFYNGLLHRTLGPACIESDRDFVIWAIKGEYLSFDKWAKYSELDEEILVELKLRYG